MAISSTQSRIQSLQKDIADLQSKLADASKKESAILQKIAQIEGRAASTTSAKRSNLNEKARQIQELAKVQKIAADLTKRIAGKTRDKHTADSALRKLEESERRRASDAEKRRRSEFGSLMRSLPSRQIGLRTLQSMGDRVTSTKQAENETSHDFFISHASEEKDEFVRPLAEVLLSLGVTVWYDDFQLRVGDSLRRSIDRGLASSRYGIVVLSSAFFAKQWPQYELDGMVAKEMSGGKAVLPIWHKVSKNEVLTYSATLADKVALNSSLLSVDEIAKQLASLVEKDKSERGDQQGSQFHESARPNGRFEGTPYGGHWPPTCAG